MRLHERERTHTHNSNLYILASLRVHMCVLYADCECGASRASVASAACRERLREKSEVVVAFDADSLLVVR